MKNNRKNTLLILLLLVAVAAWLVISNTLLKGHSATFRLDDQDWKTITYTVRQGDADRFRAELADARYLKVKYDGALDLIVDITLNDGAETSRDYVLHMYEAFEAGDDTATVRSELVKAE